MTDKTNLEPYDDLLAESNAYLEWDGHALNMTEFPPSANDLIKRLSDALREQNTRPIEQKLKEENEELREVLKKIDKALEDNCRRAPGFGSNTVKAIALIGNVVDEALNKE